MLILDLQEDGDEAWSHDDVELHIIALCVWPHAKGRRPGPVCLC